MCDLDVVSDDFMDFERIAVEKRADDQKNPIFIRSELARVIAAQEDERKRISRELHDGIAQELLTLSFVFKRLVAHVDEEGYELLAEANNDLANVLDELHNLSVQLRPSALDHLGFVAALRSQAAVFERTYGNEIVFEGSLSCDRFDQALETQAYRICQEAILNACKYSGSEKVIDQQLSQEFPLPRIGEVPGRWQTMALSKQSQPCTSVRQILPPVISPQLPMREMFC